MRRHQTTAPMRRCIGCMRSYPQDELMRFTVSGTEIIPDTDHIREGRGYYLCRAEECVEASIKRRAWNRICKANIDRDEIRKIIGGAIDDNQGGMNVKKS